MQIKYNGVEFLDRLAKKGKEYKLFQVRKSDLVSYFLENKDKVMHETGISSSLYDEIKKNSDTIMNHNLMPYHQIFLKKEDWDKKFDLAFVSNLHRLKKNMSQGGNVIHMQNDIGLVFITEDTTQLRKTWMNKSFEFVSSQEYENEINSRYVKIVYEQVGNTKNTIKYDVEKVVFVSTELKNNFNFYNVFLTNDVLNANCDYFQITNQSDMSIFDTDEKKINLLKNVIGKNNFISDNILKQLVDEKLFQQLNEDVPLRGYQLFKKFTFNSWFTKDIPKMKAFFKVLDKKYHLKIINEYAFLDESAVPFNENRDSFVNTETVDIAIDLSVLKKKGFQSTIAFDMSTNLEKIIAETLKINGYSLQSFCKTSSKSFVEVGKPKNPEILAITKEKFLDMLLFSLNILFENKDRLKNGDIEERLNDKWLEKLMKDDLCRDITKKQQLKKF